jgi:hypothetical protein
VSPSQKGENSTDIRILKVVNSSTEPTIGNTRKLFSISCFWNTKEMQINNTRENAWYRANENDYWPLETRKHSTSNIIVIVRHT